MKLSDSFKRWFGLEERKNESTEFIEAKEHFQDALDDHADAAIQSYRLASRLREEAEAYEKAMRRRFGP